MGSPKRGTRVYQYRNQDGVVFWSFDKLPSAVTPSNTLTLENRVGTHFDSYLSDLRILHNYYLDDSDEDEGR